MKRKSKIILINIFIAVLLLAIVEMILRFADSDSSAPQEMIDRDVNPDLQVHFDRIFHPETIEGRAMMVTRLNSRYERTGIDDNTRRFLTFLKEKPAGALRIFVLGSSPVWGAYHDDPDRNTLFTWHLERALKERLGEGADRYEIIDAAHVGFGGPEVIKSLNEVLNYEPDRLVIYNGGVMPLVAQGLPREDLASSSSSLGLRKLLRSVRLFRLIGMIFSRPSDAPGRAPKPQGEILPPGNPQKDAPKLEIEFDADGIPNFTPGGGRLVQPSVYAERSVNLVKNLIRITQEDYRKTYEMTFQPAAEKKTKVIACTVATNIAGIPPFWSLHWEKLSEDKLKSFAVVYEAGRSAFADGDYDAARRNLEKAVGISPTFADAQYLFAKVLEHFGETEKAKEHYHLAKEYDASNERALDRPNAILRETAAKYGFAVIDSEAAIATQNPYGIIGDDLFIDHQHPNGKGLAALADAVAREIVAGIKTSEKLKSTP